MVYLENYFENFRKITLKIAKKKSKKCSFSKNAILSIRNGIKRGKKGKERPILLAILKKIFEISRAILTPKYFWFTECLILLLHFLKL